MLRVLLAASLGVAALACAAGEVSEGRRKKPLDPGDEFFAPEGPPLEEVLTPILNEDSGAFASVPERPAPEGLPGDDAGGIDAGAPPPKIACAGPLGAGDLAIVELMISARSGSNDDGEWVEIRSTRDCWLELSGVTIASPRGATEDAVTIAGPLELGPGASFVVAGSADATKNGGIGGPLVAWNARDVLKNDGDTVVVRAGSVVIDALTYPKFGNLEAGRSLSFPHDCTPPSRASWERWSLSFGSWNATVHGRRGTPNEANLDVACY